MDFKVKERGVTMINKIRKKNKKSSIIYEKFKFKKNQKR